MKFLASVFKVF